MLDNRIKIVKQSTLALLILFLVFTEYQRGEKQKDMAIPNLERFAVALALIKDKS